MRTEVFMSQQVASRSPQPESQEQDLCARTSQKPVVVGICDKAPCSDSSGKRVAAKRKRTIALTDGDQEGSIGKT